MDLPELIKICKTEQRAFDYLFNEIQEIKEIHCPSCGSPDYYLINKKQLRCKRCRRDYHPFFGTPISGLKISMVSLLLLIKLFELEISARKASTQLDISYPTTLKAFELFRRSIARHLAKNDSLLKGEIEADESYSEDDEKESGVAEPVTTLSYLGSWNGVERYRLVFSRM